MVTAAVDRVRSIPLFYGGDATAFFISDDAMWLKDRLPDAQPDTFAVKEFMLTSYVTGSDTFTRRLSSCRQGVSHRPSS